MMKLLMFAALIAALIATPLPGVAQDTALERLEAVESLLDVLAPLEQLEREEAIRELPAEVRELLYRQILPLSAIGSELARARAAKDWDAEVAVLTRWAEHEALRRQRAAARRERVSAE